LPPLVKGGEKVKEKKKEKGFGRDTGALKLTDRSCKGN